MTTELIAIFNLLGYQGRHTTEDSGIPSLDYQRGGDSEEAHKFRIYDVVAPTEIALDDLDHRRIMKADAEGLEKIIEISSISRQSLREALPQCQELQGAFAIIRKWAKLHQREFALLQAAHVRLNEIKAEAEARSNATL